MDDRFRTQVTSGTPDSKRVFVEIEAFDPESASYVLCAEVIYESDKPEVIIYSRQNSKPWQFDYEKFVKALHSAREELRIEESEE